FGVARAVNTIRDPSNDQSKAVTCRGPPVNCFISREATSTTHNRAKRWSSSATTGGLVFGRSRASSAMNAIRRPSGDHSKL
ncbi:MAG TPA: hypothetical protein VFV58_35300, partial [Blastocatellia bacterium]|nr:hypothetical protein [Blastocatellia bacterium]